jgi:hypothetical protein
MMFSIEELERQRAEADHACQALSYGLLAIVFAALLAATAVTFWWAL